MTGYTYFGDLRIRIEQCEEVLQRMCLVLQASGSLSDDHPGVTILMSCNRLSDKGEPNEISLIIGNPVQRIEDLREIISHIDLQKSSFAKGPEDAVGIRIELPKWTSDCGVIAISIATEGMRFDENLAIAMRMLEIASECDIMTIRALVEKVDLKLDAGFFNPEHISYLGSDF